MTTKWFYKAQQMFKEWKKENDLSGECYKQEIGKTLIKEKHVLYPISGGMGTNVFFTATKEPFSVSIQKDNKTYTL